MSASVDASGDAKKRWITIGAIAVLVVVGGIAAALVLGKHTPAVAAVPSEAVATKTMTVLVSADGATMASDSTVVYPTVGGKVDHLYVAVGDTVQEGDRILSVDDADLKTAVVQAATTLAQAKQGVKQAQQGLAQAQQSLAAARLLQLQAQQSLAALRALPTTTTGIADQIALAERQLGSADAAVHTANASISTARAGISTAQASLSSAQAAYDKAVKNRASATLEAPVSGVITTLSIAEGGTLSAASAAGSSGGAASAMTASAASSAGSSGGQIVISQNSTVKVRVQVNENDLAKVKIGQAAIVTVDAAPGLEIPGRVSWISPNGVTNSGVVTYDVDIELTEQSAAVRPDMTATADITAAVIPDALVVPNSAIRVDGTRKYVDVVAADGTTRQVYVVTGSSDASSTQVTGGVTPGQRVATRAVAAKTAGGMFAGGN
jgi:multidrug efflux pump subunit AcrA (membrane-fusion protein)